MADTEIFKINDRVVYPSHGVGIVTGIEVQAIGGQEIKVFVISLSKDDMILRVPVKRAEAIGLRSVNTKEYLDKVSITLQAKPKPTKGMWSRRAQEYETKINSGDIVSISEVVRDLHKNVADPDRSYSERVIYESALTRLSGEYAAIEKIEVIKATEILLEVLNDKEEAA